MLRPHHILIFEHPFIVGSQYFFVPDLLQELDNREILRSFEGLLLNNIGEALELGSEFVVTDIKFYSILADMPYFSILVASDIEYKNQLGRFYDEMWDNNLILEDFVLIGWDVKKFLEPAVFYGLFPINLNSVGDVSISDNSSINQWGLISTHEIAVQWAKKNTVEDTEGDVWHTLAIYVDNATYSKILTL